MFVCVCVWRICAYRLERTFAVSSVWVKSMRLSTLCFLYCPCLVPAQWSTLPAGGISSLLSCCGFIRPLSLLLGLKYSVLCPHFVTVFHSSVMCRDRFYLNLWIAYVIIFVIYALKYLLCLGSLDAVRFILIFILYPKWCLCLIMCQSAAVSSPWFIIPLYSKLVFNLMFSWASPKIRSLECFTNSWAANMIQSSPEQAKHTNIRQRDGECWERLLFCDGQVMPEKNIASRSSKFYSEGFERYS